MSTMLKQVYAEQKFNLSGLNGISEKQLELHLDLYRGYVKNTNRLNEQIADLIIKGKAGSPEFADLKRHLGFEYGGMRLHEYYFGNLGSGSNDLQKARTCLVRSTAALADTKTGRKILSRSAWRAAWVGPFFFRTRLQVVFRTTGSRFTKTAIRLASSRFW